VVVLSVGVLVVSVVFVVFVVVVVLSVVVLSDCCLAVVFVVFVVLAVSLLLYSRSIEVGPFVFVVVTFMSEVAGVVAFDAFVISACKVDALEAAAGWRDLSQSRNKHAQAQRSRE